MVLLIMVIHFNTPPAQCNPSRVEKPAQLQLFLRSKKIDERALPAIEND